MTDHTAPKKRSNRNASRPRSEFSIVLGDDRLVEAVYRPSERRTLFAVWEDGACTDHKSIKVDGEDVVPYSASNNLLQHGVVLLASGPEDYGSQQALIQEIQAFIHRYVDVSPTFEKLAAYYVLLTWIYDGFNELPYLRVRGEPGCGKTRFLQTVGMLCYKAIFASGASTVSPIFRILDIVRGTLVMDESDFRVSDERAEITKILNNGNARGFPVLRSELVGRQEYDPQAYTVFGPKIVATRGFFEDRALESRFLTEDLGRSQVRSGIPITLPAVAHSEALTLRNKLLMFRFRNYGRRNLAESAVDPAVEARLNQIFGPLLTIVDDLETATSISELVRQFNRQYIADRGMESEAEVLEIISQLIDDDEPLAIKDITRAFVERFGDEYERKITVKWIGWIVRRKLLLKTQKSHGVFVIPTSEVPIVRRLCERYGVAASKATPAAKEFQTSPRNPQSPP